MRQRIFTFVFLLAITQSSFAQQISASPPRFVVAEVRGITDSTVTSMIQRRNGKIVSISDGTEFSATFVFDASKLYDFQCYRPQLVQLQLNGETASLSSGDPVREFCLPSIGGQWSYRQPGSEFIAIYNWDPQLFATVVIEGSGVVPAESKFVRRSANDNFTGGFHAFYNCDTDGRCDLMNAGGMVTYASLHTLNCMDLVSWNQITAKTFDISHPLETVGPTINILFSPAYNLTLAQAADVCGVDHFNWLQRVESETQTHNGIETAVTRAQCDNAANTCGLATSRSGRLQIPPFVDPPFDYPGGWSYFDTDVNATGGVHWGDEHPEYCDEPPTSANYIGTCRFVPSESVLSFQDTPGRPKGTQVIFTTSLRGIPCEAYEDSARPDGGTVGGRCVKWKQGFQSGDGVDMPYSSLLWKYDGADHDPDNPDPYGTSVRYGNLDMSGSSGVSTPLGPKHDAQSLAFVVVDYPGSTYTDLWGINNKGEVAGTALVNDAVVNFLYIAGTYQLLPTAPGSLEILAVGINDSEFVVGEGGTADAQYAEAFVFSADRYTFFSRRDWHETIARAVGPTGLITGFSTNYGDSGPIASVGFIYDRWAHAYTDILVPDSRRVIAQGINSAGQVVGSGELRPGGNIGFLRQPNGTMQMFQVNAQPTSPRAINDLGLIAGWVTNADGTTSGFVGAGTTFQMINVPNARSTIVEGINNLGQLVGFWDDSTGKRHGYIATPAQPASGKAADGSYSFDLAVFPDVPVTIDPPVAVGYDYEAEPSDPAFKTVVLPIGIGDNQYTVIVRGSSFNVAAGETFDFVAHGFSGGIRKFRVAGIEAAAGLNPSDSRAFPTVLTFGAGGRFTGTMMPLCSPAALPGKVPDGRALVACTH